MSTVQMEEVNEMVRDETRKAIQDAGLLEPVRDSIPAAEVKDEKLDRGSLGEFLKSALLGIPPTSNAIRKALAEGTDSAGGYLVPDEYRDELVKRLPELSELLPYTRRIPVASDAGRMPTLATDISVSWDEGENIGFEETEPTFGSLSWAIHRANAMTKTSRELLTDSAPRIADVITDLFVEAMAAECDKAIAVGDGTDQPQGLTNATGLGEVATIGVLDFPTLVEIEFTLKKKYRKRARWMMNNTNVRRVMSLVDSNNQPLFRRDLSAGAPATLLGYPVSQQDDLADGTIFFGDLRYYLWFDREQVGVESTTVGGDAFAKHQMWLKTWMRVDGKVALAEAFVKGTGITG